MFLDPHVATQALASHCEPGLSCIDISVSYYYYDDDMTYVCHYSLGLAGVRTADNAESFNKPLVVVYFDVDYVRNPKGSNYWRNRVIKVAKEFEDITFSVSDKATFAKEVADLGADSAAIAVGIYDDKGKYSMETDFR